MITLSDFLKYVERFQENTGLSEDEIEVSIRNEVYIVLSSIKKARAEDEPIPIWLGG